MRKNTQSRKKGFNSKRQPKIITGCLEVRNDKGKNISSEALVRKFIKKAKKEGIVEEYRSRKYFKSPSEVRREKKRDRKRLLEKVKHKEKELFNFTDRDRRASYRKKKKTERITNG